MGVFDLARGRNDRQVAAAFAHGDAEKKEFDSSDADTLSLEEREAKQIQAHPDTITSNAQPGLQKAEATTLVWSKKALYGTYAWIWICYFMLAFQSSIANNVMYYAYSGFAAAPLVSTAGILASVVGGVIKLPIAKLLTLWGRAEGFMFFVGVYVIGIIVIASSSGPNTYAAGYVLFWVGYDAIYLILNVFVADTSGLKNRAFAFGFVGTPFIATTFIGPLAATSFLSMTTWRWAIGAFAIIMPVVFLPLALVFKHYQKKAEKMGLFAREESGRSFAQSFIHYFHEFDIVGCILLMAAFILFLLPFSLASYGFAEYNSAKFIAMVVIGVVLFFVFAAWERFFTRVHFIRWELFKKRTVLGACSLSAILFFSFYSWDLYFYYFVYVVYDLNITYTGYMSAIYTVGSCFWSPVFGVYVRLTKHFKWACMFFGLPLMFLGAGLMIHFRGGEGSIGYVIMCQIFIAIAGGTLVIGEDMAVMASADRDGVPMMLSLIGLFSNVGGAIGYAVSAAISANVFPTALLRALPAAAKADYQTIYLGGYIVQTTYPVGSPIREAINYAWGQSQMYGCVSATAILILAIPCIGVWKNYNVDRAQNKGQVL